MAQRTRTALEWEMGVSSCGAKEFASLSFKRGLDRKRVVEKKDKHLCPLYLIQGGRRERSFSVSFISYISTQRLGRKNTSRKSRKMP